MQDTSIKNNPNCNVSSNLNVVEVLWFMECMVCCERLLSCSRVSKVLSYSARGESQMLEQQIKPGHLTELEMYSSLKVACWFENRLKWELIFYS